MIVENHRRFPDRYLVVLRVPAAELGTANHEAIGLDCIDVERDDEDLVVSVAYLFEFGTDLPETGSQATWEPAHEGDEPPTRRLDRRELEEQQANEAAALVRDAISRATSEATALEGREV